MRKRETAYLGMGVLLLGVLLLCVLSFKSSIKHNKIRDIHDHLDNEKRPQTKCSLRNQCPPDHFPFHLRSGTANTIGPKICFDGKNIMSSVHNNIGAGLNIVLVNGESGEIVRVGSFNMYSESPTCLLQFLKEIKPNMVVLVASFDDTATRMTDEIRQMFAGLGSKAVRSLAFRDGWVFVGSYGMTGPNHFEKMKKNKKKTNVYDGWPREIEMGGCIPRQSSHKS